MSGCRQKKDLNMTAYVKRASVPPHLVDDRDPPAIALLKEDHQIMRALFDLVEKIGDDVVFSIAGDLCIRLMVHMAIEEQLFYPALKPVLGVRDIDEAIVEHQVAKRLIADIMAMTGREEIFRARVHVLGEETVHHFDEEDGILFPHSRQAWEAGKIDLVELGTEMAERRRELFDIVGSVAADTHTIDAEPLGEAIEELSQPEHGNDVGANALAREEA
jgi:iron-sulfur cluster repair protein YtfE (RIC family)